MPFNAKTGTVMPYKKGKTMKQLQSTLFHAIELVVVLAVVYAASTVLNLGIVSQNQDVFVVVLAALVKFIRASENIKDYVNK